MRLAADLPAVDHVVGVRQAAASTAGQASGATLDAEVPHQIVQAIRLQWTQGVGTARVTLQPDYLGDLRIDIRVDRGAVTAVLDASNPAVRQWIEGHESTLRQGLAEQGLTLDRLVVKDEQTPPDAGAEQRRQPRDEQPPEPRRRPAAAPTDATFEVVM
jgi:flagellar hook-length control protein FliK